MSSTRQLLVLWSLGKGVNPDSFIDLPKVQYWLDLKDGLGVWEEMERHAAGQMNVKDIWKVFRDKKNKLEVMSLVSNPENPTFFSDSYSAV